jgi:hypothetical protein
MAAGRTEIIIALIGVSGVITAALIANADKMFGPKSPERAVETSAPVLALPDAAVSQTPAPTAVPDIAGLWRDGDGTSFAFTQAGASYSFIQFHRGRRVGDGRGTLAGQAFTHRFRAEAVGEGTCEGRVASDSQTSSGRCRADGGGEWDFAVVRVAATTGR